MRPPAAALLALAALLLGSLAAACASSSSDAGGLIEQLPPSLLDRGALWRSGPDGAPRLLDVLDLPPDAARATLVTGRPSVTLIDHPQAERAVEAATALGYQPDAAPDGWELLARAGLEDAEQVGIPAIGVSGDVVVVGTPEEVRQVAQQATTRGTAVPLEVLDSALAALVGTPATAEAAAPVSAQGTLPSYDAFAITVAQDGAGVVALARPDATQDDAVQLSVRLSTALVGGGSVLTTLLRPEGPLATEDEVLLPVTWLTDPPESAVVDGPRSGLVGALRVGP